MVACKCSGQRNHAYAYHVQLLSGLTSITTGQIVNISTIYRLPIFSVRFTRTTKRRSHSSMNTIIN